MADIGEAARRADIIPVGPPRPTAPATRPGTGACAQPMSTAVRPRVLSGAGGPVEASRIAWRRARSFNLLSGNRSAFGVLLAPWVWVVELANVATNASRIRRLGGASMALHDGRSARPSPGLLAVALAVTVTYCIVVVGLAVPLAGVLPIRNENVAAAVTLSILCGPLLVHLAFLIYKLARSPELRTLNRRRTELATQTGRSTLAMTSFVRAGVPGEGRQLLERLRTEWVSSSTTVILNPANRALAEYYLTQGAEIDGRSWKRLAFFGLTDSSVVGGP